METGTVGDIIARIEAHERSSPGGALAFDGDGTLWSGDIGEDYFAKLLESGTLGQVAHDALIREAEAEGLQSHGTAREIAHRIYAAYVAGAFPEERTCEIMTWLGAGHAFEAIDSFAETVMTELAIETRLHGEAIEILTWAKSRGIMVYIVSASPRAIVEQAARVVGIEPACVIAATEARTVDGIVLASVMRPIPYGPGKVARLREKLGNRALYAAFGDNAFDVPMLCEASVSVAIRPKARLVARAAEVPGIVVLEAAKPKA